MGTKGTARALLRKLRQKAPGATDAATTEPLYDVVPGGVVGCRFCNALRELFQFDWKTDPERYKRLRAEGGCTAVLPSGRNVLIERGEEFSSYRMINPVIDPGPDGMPVLWLRNVDMVEAGYPGSDLRHPSRDVLRLRAKATAALEAFERRERKG